MELLFNIDKQIIRRTDSEKPVAGSRNYLRAKFDFSEEWNNIVKTVIFSNGKIKTQVVLEEDNTCLVPWETINEGILTVSVWGGDLITANVASVDILKTGKTEASEPIDPTPTVYDQIIKMIEDGMLRGASAIPTGWTVQNF